MPWKLLFFILIIAIVLTFVGFNLQNSSDISLVFYAFKNVPVVITILASFLFGLLVAFFFTLGKLARKDKRKSAPPLSDSEASSKIIPADSLVPENVSVGEPFKPAPSAIKTKTATKKRRTKDEGKK